ARWIKQHGRDKTTEICRAGNAPLPVTIRVNRIRGTVEEVRAELRNAGVESRPGANPWSLALEAPGDVTQLPGFRAGRFQVQDDSAMGAVAALEPVDGELILDACASPGGKTSHLKESAPESKVAACDVSMEKISRVGETCSRLGHAGVRLVCADMARPPFKRDSFDAVLLDAPCSNTGVLARRPDARWRARPNDLDALSALQGRLLSSALDLLKPGGRVVYSTCSIEPEENEHVVQRALQERPEWRLEGTELMLPSPRAGGGFFARIGRP
ncbi:MAG TPA: RsmB/NOP family class I SAM-dependent RNA methyltransferase, partial [Planctomycetota bacterium]|nr:RsmB/NOP family class I SAM-dependent RNA methyltransferase [Planctomycetota bacterium]